MSKVSKRYIFSTSLLVRANLILMSPTKTPTPPLDMPQNFLKFTQSTITAKPGPVQYFMTDLEGVS